MKYSLTTFLVLITCMASHAQLFDKIKKKAEEAAEKVVEKAVGDKDDSQNEAPADGTADDATDKVAAGVPARAAVSPAFDFLPGDSLIFKDSFLADKPGSMPHWWKSSGSGQVVQFSGVAGNWLLLNEFTTYKLDTLLAMPSDFSLEFDLLTRSDQAEDLLEFKFGFASDNSVRDYLSDAYNDNAITQTTIHYWNKEIVNSSSDTEIYNTNDFELENYANETMHVSIQVNGENMAVYLDDKKVLDTNMFDPGAKKYFYLSTGIDLKNEAQIAISNLQLKQ